MKTENTKADIAKSDRSFSQVLGQYVERWLCLLAALLNRKTKSWSAFKMKTALVLFCIATSTVCILIVFNAVVRSNSPPQVGKISQRPKQEVQQRKGKDSAFLKIPKNQMIN
jgi:hypothetical protein